MARTDTPQDAMDGLVAAAAGIWPSIETLPHGVVVRFSRALSIIHTDLEAVAADFGISLATLEALATLRLAPPPHRLSQREVGELLMRTSGTLSVRLARLEQAGLISREPDPDDARGVIVQLSPRGRELVDAAVAARLQAESKLLSPLTRQEQEQLCGLLRKLLVSLEQRETGPQLGLEIAPRRAAWKLRRDHGIADGVGLLVAAVHDRGLADQAGIAPGDLVLRLDRIQLRSTAQLKRGLRARAHGGILALTLLRDGREVRVTVRVPHREAPVLQPETQATRKPIRPEARYRGPTSPVS